MIYAEHGRKRRFLNSFQALSLDPRSPSGLPRTPIVIEDEEANEEGNGKDSLASEENKENSGKAGNAAATAPKRGAIKSKLSFTPEKKSQSQSQSLLHNVSAEEESEVNTTEEETRELVQAS